MAADIQQIAITDALTVHKPARHIAYTVQGGWRGFAARVFVGGEWVTRARGWGYLVRRRWGHAMPPAEGSRSPSCSLPSPPPECTPADSAVSTPTRTWSVNRRYNDFAALDAELRSATGKETPAPLPPKHWFARTMNDEEVSAGLA